MENSNNNNNNRISIPVTLKGINYLLWARMVKIALGGKGLWSHVSTEAAPKQTTQGEDGQEMVVADEDKWAQEDRSYISRIKNPKSNSNQTESRMGIKISII